MKSVGNLFEDLIKTKDLDFLLIYKISQDHLEIFFLSIRLKGGFNNNPTASQSKCKEENYLDLLCADMSDEEVEELN